jgi:predicted pyridoxine 5'-phosphate oxidase superfamily flavin-nucleotide-binding protein
VNYAKLAFTEPVKAIQEELGSREAYGRMEKVMPAEGLSLRERSFIEQRDSFYVASYGENDYPYIQHRGGPKGFLKVIDEQTLAFLDFRGNKQYITTGNVATHNKVSLILVDYPGRSRLKIYAEAEVIGLDDQPGLREILELENYRYKAERIFVFKVKAFDWNCPQHITPRYTVEEIAKMAEDKDNYIESLKEEIKTLKEELEGCGPKV